jgi:TctA family transporter
MKKNIRINEAIGLIISSFLCALFLMPILGSLPLIENDFIFYGTMLPLIFIFVYIFLTSKGKKGLIWFGLFLLVVSGVLLLLSVDFRDIYFLIISLICFLYAYGSLFEDSTQNLNKPNQQVKKVSISSSQSKIKH